MSGYRTVITRIFGSEVPPEERASTMRSPATNPTFRPAMEAGFFEQPLGFTDAVC
jgi:hypothetical protein